MQITTTIPYVNARPHLGFLLELVQADVLARHHRRLGTSVRQQTGTDDNSLKNVLAAEAASVPVADFVDRNAAAFTDLHEVYDLCFDDVVHTSRDPRHRAGVERLWRACDRAGDLYRKRYVGFYCVGCEQFYPPGERCPEHDEPPRRVAEENWFFRLSRYAEPLRAEIGSGRLRVHPEQRRNEVLAFLAGGVEDISISRTAGRAHGWGIPVPGDPDQVIYVWWDALGNYVTGPGERAWAAEDRRIHVLGKGVVRFHAVYWPAMLLSAGLPLPTDLVVHDYLTVDGRKISKSGRSVDPAELAARRGADAVRWWLLRDVPRVGDTDFTEERLVARANDELANGIGNLVHRIVSMVHRYRDGVVPPARDAPLVFDRSAVDEAFAGFDLRRATDAVWAHVVETNRWVSRTRPWRLDGAELDVALATAVDACRVIGTELEPFLPRAAAGIVRRCTPVDGRLPVPERLFDRLDLATDGPNSPMW